MGGGVIKRVNRILSNPLFMQYMEINQAAEAGSAFCKHDVSHMLDVARIAQLYNIKKRLGFSIELIYAAALLHDITKGLQIMEGVPHNESAIAPSTKILQDAEFCTDEVECVIAAILNHRKGPKKSTKFYAFSRLIYKADKLSRNCFLCKCTSCDWSHKNSKLKV